MQVLTPWYFIGLMQIEIVDLLWYWRASRVRIMRAAGQLMAVSAGSVQALGKDQRAQAPHKPSASSWSSWLVPIHSVAKTGEIL